jgi:hypothetical protein
MPNKDKGSHEHSRNNKTRANVLFIEKKNAAVSGPALAACQVLLMPH